MIDEHAAAILALLTAVDDPPPLNVHDGEVPPGTDPRTQPYVLVYFDSADPEATKEAAPYRFVLTVTCHSVAGSARAARMVGDRVRNALLAVTPTVAGRTCFPIYRDYGRPPSKDEVTGSVVMDQVDVYRLESLPG